MVAVIALILCIQGGAALGCSMSAITTAEDWIAQSEGAFVGVPVTQRLFGDGRIKYSFIVEWVVKGPIERRIDVESSVDAGMCGLGKLDTGKRIGMSVDRDQGRWFADMGDRFAADEMLEAAPEGAAKHLGSIGLIELWRLKARAVSPGTIAAIGAVVAVFIIAVWTARRPKMAPADSQQRTP